MADYFTYFSVVLPLTKEQQEYGIKIAHLAELNRFGDQELPSDFPDELRDAVEGWAFETELTEKGLWLNSHEGGQESACSFIQHLLQKFDFAPGIAFEWSHDCSKPRPDAYGGGAAFITSTEIETFSTSEWLQKVAVASYT